MSVGSISRANVVVASLELTVYELARLMKEKQVGDIVIVDEQNHPVGIVTDRDLVIKVMADDIGTRDTVARDVMSQDLLVLKDSQSIQEALDMLCAKGVRRAPVVNDEKLIGVVTMDDFAVLISDAMESCAKLIRKQHGSIKK